MHLGPGRSQGGPALLALRASMFIRGEGEMGGRELFAMVWFGLLQRKLAKEAVKTFLGQDSGGGEEEAKAALSRELKG